jgi:hypothetical protein
MAEYKEFPKVLVHKDNKDNTILVHTPAEEDAKFAAGYVKNGFGNRKAFESLVVTKAPLPNSFREYPKALPVPKRLQTDRYTSALVTSEEHEKEQLAKWEKELADVEEADRKAAERLAAAPRPRDESGKFARAA